MNIWTAVTNQPVVIGNQNVVVQGMSDPHRYYRLARQEGAYIR